MEMDTSVSPQMDTPVLPDGSSELEAMTLAREIQQLVHSLPPATTTTDDSRLIALLSNASFMNGSSLKTSIWAMLENMHRASSPPASSSPTHVGSEIHTIKVDEPTAAASSSNVYPNQLSNDSFSDTSSIMVYSPLFPTQSDIVELAELVPYDTDSGEVEERDVVVNSGDTVRTQEVLAGRPSWSLKWPFSIWYRQNQSQQRVSQSLSSSLGSGGPQQQSAEFTTSSQVGTNNVDTNPTTQRIRTVKSQRSKRAWVPSLSKISIQAFWWGFRLYLPPPIIETLSDGSMEATRQTETITNALTWFFNALPIDAFPLHMRHYLVLLQLLIPFIGYIASFISRGFATWIGGLEVGCGITLTATWIVPVALIPGTWYETDFPKSPLPNSPIPLPPNRPFSMQSFELATPAISTMTMTDDGIPTSAYATPLSSVISIRPLDENKMPDLSLASSSTAWSASPPPQLPPHLPISSPIRFPTTDLPNSSNDSIYFTPDSQTTTPIAHRFFQPLPSTSSAPFFTHNNTTLPSPRIRTPRFSTRMGSYSPFINGNKRGIPPHLIIHNTTPLSPSPITPIPTSTPIPMPPTPIDLPPIPPELPLSPILANELLRGPVLQTVPLPDVDDDHGHGNDGVRGVGGVGVGVGVGGDLDRSLSGMGKKVVGRTTRTRASSNLKNLKKGVKMEKGSGNARTFSSS